MVELALSAPFLIVLLMGLAEIGHGLNSYLTVLNAARDGARFGAQVGATDTTRLKNLINSEMERLDNVPLNLGCTGPSICITSCTTTDTPCATPPPGQQTDKWLDIKVCYDHDMIIGIPWVMEGPILMCSETRIRIAL
jgi:hypothetical protein